MFEWQARLISSSSLTDPPPLTYLGIRVTAIFGHFIIPGQIFEPDIAAATLRHLTDREILGHSSEKSPRGMEELNLEDIVVTNNEAERQFEAEANGSVAVSKYMLAGGQIIFTHTEVPPELEGKGVAGKLIRSALDHARAEGLAVWPLCPFVRSYLERHPEYQDLVSQNPRR